jgi:hypothetical protein
LTLDNRTCFFLFFKKKEREMVKKSGYLLIAILSICIYIA